MMELFWSIPLKIVALFFWGCVFLLALAAVCSVVSSVIREISRTLSQFKK
jgi:hypothetical protein